MAFVLASSLVMVLASERLYWYLDGITWSGFVQVAIFYAVPTAVALWAAGSGPSATVHQMVLVGALYAFTVEGVLTTVVYQDGALPVLAAMFVGWHGLLAVVCFWFLARRLLLQRRTRALLVGSAAIGAMWGLWSLTWRLPESTAEFDDPLPPLDPPAFAGYALVVGLALMVGHVALGHVWPTRFVPTRGVAVLIVVVTVAYGAVAVLPSVWWAPAKLAVLGGTTGWLLHRSRRARPDAPSAITAMRGVVPLRSTLPLLAMPVVAAAVYAGVWAVDPADSTVRTVHEVMYLSQVLAGVVAYGWAAVVSLRTNGPAGAAVAGPGRGRG